MHQIDRFDRTRRDAIIVCFRDGADVLRHYWGHLRHGGLYLPAMIYRHRADRGPVV